MDCVRFFKRFFAVLMTLAFLTSGLRSSTAFASDKKAAKGWTAHMSSSRGERISLTHLRGKTLLKSDDLIFGGVTKPLLAGTCAGAKKNLNLRLGLTEYELELKMLIQKLRRQKKPRRLSTVHQNLIHEIPACEDFQLKLAVISKLLKNYDLERIERIN